MSLLCFETTHQQLWSEWIEWEKKGVKGERQHVKKRFSPIPSTILSLFVSDVLYAKNDPH
jgi:hypothetical protein